MRGKICIHGHFYQPPRENPWTGVVGREHSAAPWHDWNQRITDECYRPNTAARILDREGRILKVSDNYSRISYDFGPTLLTWLERERRDVYDKVVQADTRARERFSGHGNALAHPYHHVIMPLISRTDKETEVRWGLRDFEERFDRYPEGAWLPEMAVDLETLDVLADHGILFTLLSPHQALGVRHIHDETWTGDREGIIDTTVPYLCSLPGGKEISVFFHDSGLGTRVAFGDLLENGDRFSDLLLSSASNGGIVHFATDGETFGHHHPFGEMALAWCLDRIDFSHPGTLTVYGEHLAKHPAEQEVDIVENTSWSCPHGIGRWTGGCACESGRHPGWDHGWRGPLRRAVEKLSTDISAFFEREAGKIFDNPRAARDDAIRILRDGSKPSVDRFFTDNARHTVDQEQGEKALALLEMARQCLALQTSCAWFFDDIADREAVQILRSAARAMQLARDRTGADLEPAFLRQLCAIHGNRPEYPDGGVVYRECVLPLVLAPEKEAACLALMDAVRGTACNPSHDVPLDQYLTWGELYPRHDLSFIGKPITYCFLAFGPKATLGLSFTADLPLREIAKTVFQAARGHGYAAAAEEIISSFQASFTLADFPPGAKKMVFCSQIQNITETFSKVAGEIFERYIWLEDKDQDQAHSRDGHPSPAWCLLVSRMDRMLVSPVSTTEDLRILAKMFTRWGVTSLPQALHRSSGLFMSRQMKDWASCPEDRERLAAVTNALRLLQAVGIRPPLWELQNQFIAVRDGTCGFHADGDRGDRWVKDFHDLGDMLGVNVE
jgi:hypothetical protein